MSIQRYDVNTGRRNDNGSIVTYADHIAAVTELMRALREYRKSHIVCEILTSKFFEEGFADHRCVYCVKTDALLAEYKEIA